MRLAGDTAERRLLEQIAMRVIDVPGMFTIMPVDRTTLDPRGIWSKPVKITLWCTHPGECHPVSEASYETAQPKEWFARTLPYFKTTLRLLKLTPIVRGALSDCDVNEVVSHLQALEALCSAIEDELFDKEGIGPISESELNVWRTDRTESPLDREIKRFLLRLGNSNSFSPLHKVITPSGDVAWVCPVHYDRHYSTPTVYHDNDREATVPSASSLCGECAPQPIPLASESVLKLARILSAFNSGHSDLGTVQPPTKAERASAQQRTNASVINSSQTATQTGEALNAVLRPRPRDPIETFHREGLERREHLKKRGEVIYKFLGIKTMSLVCVSSDGLTDHISEKEYEEGLEEEMALICDKLPEKDIKQRASWIRYFVNLYRSPFMYGWCEDVDFFERALRETEPDFQSYLLELLMPSPTFLENKAKELAAARASVAELSKALEAAKAESASLAAVFLDHIAEERSNLVGRGASAELVLWMDQVAARLAMRLEQER